jgi:hypothetical protein
MIPFKLTPAQFRERYQRGLERASRTAIAAIAAQLALPLAAQIQRAEVEIFVGDEDPHEPAVWIYYQGQDNRVDNSDPGLFPGKSMPLALGLEGLEDFNPRFFSDEKFGGLDIVAQVLVAWVAECWWKAGGWRYPLPALLQVHDGYGGGKPVKLTECTT